MRSSQIMLSPKCNDQCPQKRREGEKTHREEGNVKKQAEIRMISLETKECQDSHWKLVDKRGTDSLSEPPEEISPTGTSILDFWPPGL